MIELTLNKKDIKDCRNLAKLRDAKKVRFGAGRHGNLTSSSEESHFLGLLGEKALSNAFYLDLDRSINDDGGHPYLFVAKFVSNPFFGFNRITPPEGGCFFYLDTLVFYIDPDRPVRPAG